MTDPTISTAPANNTEPANNTTQPGPALPPDIDALSYEEAREQLVAVVSS